MAFNTQWYDDMGAALRRPLETPSPCGPDLEYDRLYMELFTKLVPREKKTVGQVSGKPTLETNLEPVPWAEVERDCLSLLERTRDVRLLIVLTRCRVRRDQGAALAWGLRLLADTLELWPEEAHPALSQDGEYDVQARAAALSDLKAQEGLLADIRRIPVLPQAVERRELRHVEQSLAMPRAKEADPPEQARRGLAELRERGDANLAALAEALGLARKLDADMSRRLEGADFSLSPLITLLEYLEPPAEALEDAPVPELAAPANEIQETGGGISEGGQLVKQSAKAPRGAGRQPKTAAPPPPSLPTPTITPAARIPSRNFAREQIGEIREWFETNEPSSPIALLLAQAEAMVGKRFSELVSFLPREILEQWEKKE